MKSRIVYGFILFFLCMGRAFGNPLSLEEVLTSVSTHYPLMMGARMELQKAEADNLSAQGGFDPVLKSSYSSTSGGYYNNTYIDVGIEQPTALWGTKVFAGWRSGQGYFPPYDGKYATFTEGEFRGGVEVPLLRNGSFDERRFKAQASVKGIEVAHRGVELQKLDLDKLAAHKYWDWVAAGKKLKTAVELLEISLIRDKALIDRVKHGDSAQIDQVDNLRAVTQRQSAVIAAERALQKAALELSLFLRDASGAPWVIEDTRLPSDFPEPNLNELSDKSDDFNRYLGAHPEIQRYQIQTDQLQLEYSLAVNQVMPRLDFNLGIYSDMGTNPGGPNVLPPSGYPGEVRLGLQLEFPLLFRAPRGKREAVSITLNKLSLMQKLARDRLEVQLNDASQAMKASYKRVTLARKEIDLNAKLEEAERVRFQHGESNVLMINIREQITRDAWVKEFEALADFFKSKAEYIAARGEAS